MTFFIIIFSATDILKKYDVLKPIHYVKDIQVCMCILLVIMLSTKINVPFSFYTQE